MVLVELLEKKTFFNVFCVGNFSASVLSSIICLQEFCGFVCVLAFCWTIVLLMIVCYSCVSVLVYRTNVWELYFFLIIIFVEMFYEVCIEWKCTLFYRGGFIVIPVILKEKKRREMKIREKNSRTQNKIRKKRGLNIL